jgi:hypothetical protein
MAIHARPVITALPCFPLDVVGTHVAYHACCILCALRFHAVYAAIVYMVVHLYFAPVSTVF